MQVLVPFLSVIGQSRSHLKISVLGMSLVGSTGLSLGIKGLAKELPSDLSEGLIELSVLSVAVLGLALDVEACMGANSSLFLLE